MRALKTLAFMIFIGLILGFLNTSCGTDEVIEKQTEEESIIFEGEEPDTWTIMLCQQNGESCDSNGICTEDTKPVEFEVDSSLIYWQACFDFRPCDEDSKNLYTEDQIAEYKANHC